MDRWLNYDTSDLNLELGISTHKRTGQYVQGGPSAHGTCRPADMGGREAGAEQGRQAGLSPTRRFWPHIIRSYPKPLAYT